MTYKISRVTAFQSSFLKKQILLIRQSKRSSAKPGKFSKMQDKNFASGSLNKYPKSGQSTGIENLVTVRTSYINCNLKICVQIELLP